MQVISRPFRGLALLLALAMLLPAAGAAQESDAARSAQTIWRLLDYIAVDYPAAVEDGEVISEFEYAEMREFAASVATRLETLPPTPERDALIDRTGELEAAIAGKVPPPEVAGLARGLADDLLAAYPVTLAPTSAPDLARGAEIYAAECAACHGAEGAGDGPLSEGMEPPPIPFTDRARARERSIFSLYQVTTQGLEDTPMTSFDHLPREDRWAVAFYSGTLAFSEGERAAGRRLWESDDGELAAAIPDLEALVRATPAGLAEALGTGRAAPLMAYLRANPSAVERGTEGSLALVRTRLDELLEAYRAGDAGGATDLALSAYLDGFEPVEPLLAARDGALMRRIEGAMIELRNRIGRGVPAEEVAAQIAAVEGLIDEAEAELAGDAAGWTASFIGALTILLREGLEAILVVIAMIAFLRKAERPEILRYVHGGWIAALIAGGLTWIVATKLIAISGAGRELTEGLGGVLAALVLVSVGIWMHGKSQADAWQRYIKAKMSHALSRRSAWFLFALAFVVVYREAFETILFFIALWGQGDQAAIMAGGATATVLLAGIAWALLVYSVKLPIAQFFRFSSILIGALAVVLAGKGISALQEAGWIDVSPLAAAPRIEILGLYPTMEGIAVQVLTLLVLLAAFRYNSRRPAVQ